MGSPQTGGDDATTITTATAAAVVQVEVRARRPVVKAVVLGSAAETLAAIASSWPVVTVVVVVVLAIAVELTVIRVRKRELLASYHVV